MSLSPRLISVLMLFCVVLCHGTVTYRFVVYVVSSMCTLLISYNSYPLTHTRGLPYKHLKQRSSTSIGTPFLSRVSILTSDIDIAQSVHLFVRPLRSGIVWKRLNVFLSASLYVSKRGAYWDRLCRDVVGRWLAGRWLSRACTVAKRRILGL